MRADNAPRLQCRMIAEGANGPTSLEADAILRARGIPILPDILTNAGGVTVSYFEWVQDLGRLFWGRDEIRAKLAEKLNDAFDRVWEIAREGRDPAAHGGDGHRYPRRLHGARGTRAVSVDMDRVRDAMIAEPRSLDATATAQEAGEVLTPPEVRAVFVVGEDGMLVGVVTRKTLVARVVAEGRDPATTPLAEVAEEPHYTIGPDLPVDDAFHFIEEHDAERVPVVEEGRLIGVLSRAVLQRRLAEDEEPSEDAAGASARCCSGCASRPGCLQADTGVRAPTRGAVRAVLALATARCCGCGGRRCPGRSAA